MDMPASGAKMTKMKKPMKARVTGGPGYVSESAATAGVRFQRTDGADEEEGPGHGWSGRHGGKRPDTTTGK